MNARKANAILHHFPPRQGRGKLKGTSCWLLDANRDCEDGVVPFQT